MPVKAVRRSLMKLSQGEVVMAQPIFHKFLSKQIDKD